MYDVEILEAPFGAEVLFLIRQRLASDLAAVTLTTEDDNLVVHLFSQVGVDGLTTYSENRQASALSDQVISHRKDVVINSQAQFKDGMDCAFMRAHGFQAYLGLPIMMGQRVIGALELIMELPRVWGRNETDLARRFATAIGIQMNTQNESAFHRVRETV